MSSKLLIFIIVLISLFLTSYGEEVNICDANYKCEVYQTCCHFGDGNYGCCPYAYANCCQGVNACCQSGFSCQSNGTGCVRMEV